MKSISDKIIGKIFDSNNFGKFIILGKIEYIPTLNNMDNKQDIDSTRYCIKFIETGYITDASYSSIRHGSVRDNLFPSVAGIGYVGCDINISDPYINIFYKSWNDMINRCYNINDKDYKYYGYIGIKVCKRWHNFSIFLEDIQCIPNFLKKIKYPDIYQLDKDYLQMNIPKNQRIYSPETCVWISKYDNTIIMTRERENSSGYYGVFYIDNSWKTRINNVYYGSFINPIAAANLFNYYYPLIRNEFNDILILNNVENIPYDELYKYCVGSTTIRKIGVVSKWIQSDRASIPLDKLELLNSPVIDEDIVSTSS